LQAEKALDSWREWHGQLRTRPVILGPLSGGRSNRSFLLDSEGSRMVLRINGSESLLPNSNRSVETAIWQMASDKGIAPPLLYADRQGRFLISSYIQNCLPPNPQRDGRVVERAFVLLKQCHQLGVEAPSIDYPGHVEQYWQMIEDTGRPIDATLQDRREPMRLLLDNITGCGAPSGLCHHDLVVENFVGSTDRLYLIDWEYAARGLLVMDYAALGVEWGIDDATIVRQTGVEPALLVSAKMLYQYLCALWGEQQP